MGTRGGSVDFHGGFAIAAASTLRLSERGDHAFMSLSITRDFSAAFARSGSVLWLLLIAAPTDVFASWPPDGLPLSTASGYQFSVTLATDGSFGDHREPFDLEEILEALLGGFALVALAGKNPEQVPALSFGHGLGAVAEGCRTANRSTCPRGRTAPTSLSGVRR